MIAARPAGVGRLVGVGLVAGVFSSLFGVGGGIVIVPLLLMLTTLSVHEATATSLGAILITALAGVALYALRGQLRPDYAVLVGVPAVVGALVGARVQQQLSSSALTLGFAGLLAAISVWLIVS